MAGADLARVQQWLYTTLSGDATIAGVVGSRVFAEQAPQEAELPLVLFAHIGNVDVLRTIGLGRVARTLWLVRAVGNGESVQGSLRTVADRFDPLLIKSNIVVDNVLINTVQHDQFHVRSDAETGVPVSYIGSYYLIFCQPI